MTKRFISLLLAVLLLATMAIGAFADKEEVEYTVGAETMKMICEKQGLDYDFCKAAIIQLNDAFETEEDFGGMLVGQKIKLPETNQAAAEILGVALPDSLKPKASGSTFIYTVKDKDTVIGICNTYGLDYTKCKTAIMKLNGWYSDYFFTALKTGDKIKMPSSDADAAVIAAATGTATATATATTTTTTTAVTTLGAGNAVAAYMVPHVVQAGETIYGICVENGIDFSRYFNLIMQASGIAYATSLHAGDIIYIPSSSASGSSMSIVAHTVSGGETTYGICQDLGVNYSTYLNMIAALNPGKNLSAIHTGDVLYFPASAVKAGTAATATAAAATGTATATAASGAGYGGAYTPAASTTATTPAAVKAKEGAIYYLKEITVATDDTVYALVKAAGFDYTTYYADVLLAANKLANFNSLKSGDKLLMLSSAAAGAKITVTGVKVKSGDTVIKMCDDKGISYSDNMTLIAKLNPGVNFNNLKTDDIIVLPVGA